MKLSVAFLTTFLSLASGQLYEMIGDGVNDYCSSTSGYLFDFASIEQVTTPEACDEICRRSNNYREGLLGFGLNPLNRNECRCLYDNGTGPGKDMQDPQCPASTDFTYCNDNWYDGSGGIKSDTTIQSNGWQCFRYKDDAFTPPEPTEPAGPSEATGDPHCKYAASFKKTTLVIYLFSPFISPNLEG